ncbi:MAG: LysR family transcriptional regulator, partial [Hydrogenophaga sp.]|nr:LysR family transcriptional regulator [Hydrogenophaga sp.]
SDLVQTYLTAIHDPRTVIAEPGAHYFGAEIHDSTLVPGANPRLGTVCFKDWLAAQASARLAARP